MQRFSNESLLLMRIKAPCANGAPKAGKSVPARVINALADVAPAAFAYGKNKVALVSLIRITGATKAARDRFIVGHMAFALHPKAETATYAMLAKAETVMAAKGKGSTGKLAKGQSRRTEAQERAYGAARKAWHLVVKAAEVTATDNRGGANNTGKVKTGSNKPDIVKAAANDVAPKAATAEVANEYFRQTAVTALAFANKNAGITSPEIGLIVRRFHREMLAALTSK